MTTSTKIGFIFIFTLLLSCQHSNVSSRKGNSAVPFEGKWKSVSKNASISRLAIGRTDSGKYSVDAWAKCGATECFWGRAVGIKTVLNSENVLNMSWTHKGHTRNQTAFIVNGTLLRVVTRSVLRDGDQYEVEDILKQ